MKNSSYYIVPVGDRTHDLPNTVASNNGKVSHALNHSATAAVKSQTRSKVVEKKLEEWRRVMEDRGLKINRNKTVYLRFNVNGNLDGNSDINIQEQNLERVNTFKYLGATLAENGDFGLPLFFSPAPPSPSLSCLGPLLIRLLFSVHAHTTPTYFPALSWIFLPPSFSL